MPRLDVGEVALNYLDHGRGGATVLPIHGNLGCTNLNAALLAPGEWMPARTSAYPFMHGQYFRECEFSFLLARVTHRSANPSSPFVAALRRIEQENGRMIQTQIRLLKETPLDLPASEREAMLEEAQAVVDDVFERFLEWLAGDADKAFALPIRF